MSKFKNKVAIITASATGIGYSIAEKLAKEGASVVISSRNQENINLAVEKLKKQNLNAIGCVCHVGKLQHLKKLINFTIENFGKIDIIVPNAAVSTFYGAFIDTPENAMDKMFSVNIKSVILFIQLSYPYLLKSETPNISNFFIIIIYILLIIHSKTFLKNILFLFCKKKFNINLIIDFYT